MPTEATTRPASIVSTPSPTAERRAAVRVVPRVSRWAPGPLSDTIAARESTAGHPLFGPTTETVGPIPRPAACERLRVRREQPIGRHRSPCPHPGDGGGPLLLHPKVHRPLPCARCSGSMTEERETPRFREHLHAMREALAGVGRDVELDVADAPHLAKEGTKNALARAAGLRRRPIEEWAEPPAPDQP